MKLLLNYCLPFLVIIMALGTCDSGVCGDCTDELRMEFITVKDQDQNAVVLDSYQVINTQTNVILSSVLTPEELDLAQQEGRYPLIDDTNIGVSQTLELQFQGFKDGTQVITENYTVTSDCCSHIDLVVGNGEIILN